MPTNADGEAEKEDFPYSRQDFLQQLHYRTNIHHTLKKNPLVREHLQDFVDCYNPQNRHERIETWHLEAGSGSF